MQYEDMLGRQRPPRKPGYRSPPQRKAPTADSWRRSFSKQLIAALEDAAGADTKPQTAQQLAQAAYDKLQFDFPLVSGAELEALVTAYRTSLDADAWPLFPLTAKLLQNALEGSHLPPAPSSDVLTGGPAAAASNATNGASAAAINGHSMPHSGTSASSSASAGSPIAAAAAQQPSAEPAAAAQQQADKLRLVTLYQQLAACLIVKLARRAMQAPPEEAFRQLAGFMPDLDAAVAAAASHARPAQQRQPADDDAAQQLVQRLQGSGPLAADSTPDCAGGLQFDTSGSHPQAAEATLAAQEDGDEDVYEDLVPLPPPQQRPQTQQQGHYSWDALHVKLAALAAHAQCSSLASDVTWQQLRLADDVTAFVSEATWHQHAAELAGVSSAYVELLAQRIADAPAAVSAFGPLCTALGSSEPVQVAARGMPVTMPLGLRTAAAFAARTLATLLPPPGASTGASAVTAAGRAAADARAAAAARSLARGVYDALLPPLGRWLGAVAAAKPKSGSSAAAGTALSAEAAGAADAEADTDTEADVVLACRVVSAALLGAQAAGGSNKQLLDSGVFRALVVLLAAGHFRHLPELRLAVLLAAVSDASLAAWAAAVPAFVPALIHPCFQEGGEAAAEGAVWAHLLPAAKRPPTLPALEQLLLVDGADSSLDACQQQVASLRSTLLLLADCRTAGGGRRPWGESATSRLRALPTELNALDMRLGTAAITAAAVAPPAAAAVATSTDAAAAVEASVGHAEVPQERSISSLLAVESAAAASLSSLEAETVQTQAADEPPEHRQQWVEGASPQHGTVREAAAGTALRRACRQCATLAKDLAAGGQDALAAAKRD